MVGPGAEVRLDPVAPAAERLDRCERFGRVAAPDAGHVRTGGGQRLRDAATDAGVRARDRGDAAPESEKRTIEGIAHFSTFIGTQATSLYSWFSPPIAQMKL